MNTFGKTTLIEKLWYKKDKRYWLLIPLSWLYGTVVFFRRYLYQKNVLTSWQAPVPVIIVGNITVGGTGKTPLVIWLIEQLKHKGLKVAVVSRGYGSQSVYYPRLIEDNTAAKEGGDEPVLIYQRTGVPVAISSNRREAIELILARYCVDIIISDDGLQHYALQRDFEIAVIDGKRRFGNGWLLPAGPLREPVTRLSEVNAIVINQNSQSDDDDDRHHAVTMSLKMTKAINLVTGETCAITALQRVVAIAGIGDPHRFFAALAQVGINIDKNYAFRDHQDYQLQQLNELNQPDLPLVMTEKDAVKCRSFAKPNWWYIPVEAVIEEALSVALIDKIVKSAVIQKNVIKVN